MAAIDEPAPTRVPAGVVSDGARAAEEPVDVRLERVTKRFGDMVAVDDLSLEIRSGEFISLLGPSGCGKTTTLRMIGGFEDPSLGRIFLGGTDVTALPPHRRDVNTVFQSYAVFPHLNVSENVAFGLRCKHVSKREITQQVQDALDLVDMSSYGPRKPSQLSGGQQQRVALARALVNRPKLLLLDEPMSALDAKLRKQMQIELKRIQTEVGITFLYVTHDQEEAMTMSDRIAVMVDGHIEGLGAPQQLYEHPGTEFVATFLGASNLLTGQVATRTADAVTVTVDGGTITAATGPGTDAPSGTVRLGVRPEKIQISAEDRAPGPGWNAVRGTLMVATFTGVGNQYLVEGPAGTSLTVYAQNRGGDPVPGAGERVLLTWRPEHTFIVRASGAHTAPAEGFVDNREEQQ
ncbi:MAG: ABC transporter ATP-binding protein [Solirubrobacteraceae bacterium]